MPLLPLLLLLLTLTLQGGHGQGIDYDIGQNPSFCRDRDCAPFKLLATEDEYEVREYRAIKLLCTEFHSPIPPNNDNFFKPNGPRQNAYNKLRQYLLGENSEGLTIRQTLPVATRVCTENNSCKKDFQLCFYLPMCDPPQPLDDDLIIRPDGDEVFYARGSSHDEFDASAWQDNVDALDDAVADLGDANPAFYLMAAYGPEGCDQAYNEVWRQRIPQQ